MNWHYVENGEQAGPVSAEQLKQLFQEGRINADTLVWQPGLDNWMPYRQVSGDFSPSVAATAPVANEVACSECGRIFPASETISHGNANICVDCKPVFLQKLSEGAKIYTGALNLAGIGTRFAAAFLDGLLLMAVNFGLGLVVGVAAGRSAGAESSAFLATQVILFIVNTAIGIAYETIMVGKYGATLGKMACKIKVVTADGGKVTYARALGRHFAKMLSTFTIMIGYLIACFDKEKRALHDHICNTRVVIK